LLLPDKVPIGEKLTDGNLWEDFLICLTFETVAIFFEQVKAGASPVLHAVRREAERERGL